MEDGITNDTMLVKIFHENEAEKDAFVEAADGWMKIALKHHKIFRVDIPLDTIEEVKCDTGVLSFFIDHCYSSQWETGSHRQ